MTYNIHPLFVHFPIAFLLLYSVITLIPFERWFKNVSWRYVRLVLLVAGVLGAMAASSTGEMAEHLVHPNRKIVEFHSLFAGITTWVYGLILAGEILDLGLPYVYKKIQLGKIQGLLERIKNLLIQKVLVKILAVLGFIFISITGLLGGVMVYGTTADPLAKIVLQLLGIQ